LRERDTPRGRYADVVLVLDASASMAGPKLAAARSAALGFAASLALPEDRLAVVRFDEQARIELDLSGDEAAIAAALDRITPRQGTRIDRGLAAAVEVLEEAKRTASSNDPYVLLLTDGRQSTGLGSSRVAAARLRDAGVTVHAIGIGAGHDAEHLAALAGDPSRYHAAIDGGALHAILLGLQGLRSCAPQGYWGRRCR
jgi:Mg-chelatase subunit ChlD